MLLCRYVSITYNVVLLVVLINVVSYIRSSQDPRQLEAVFHQAVKLHNYKKVKQYIRNGVDVNSVIFESSLLEKAVHHVAIKNDCYMMQLLIAASADINSGTIIGRNTPLYDAVSCGAYDVARLLINARADIHIANNKGYTPFYNALHGNRAPIIQDLVDNKADVNAVDRFGFAPLQIAIKKGYIEVVNVLLLARAAVNWSNAQGLTSLHFASIYNGPEITKKLIDHNADIKVIDKDGDTPLKLAAERGHGEVVRVLLAARADPNEWYGK